MDRSFAAAQVEARSSGEWTVTSRAVPIRRYGALRICSRAASFAHAFHEPLGGKLVPPDARAVALAADPLNSPARGAGQSGTDA
ncbi:hypothetical protein AB4099_26665 [Bosea sp. 2KB_26]|uniref:hypothetical protein n=1 Tax=Bosea sp. 2KB_26 TaxID=3237475 RepID=UPI003F91CD2C